MNGPSAVIIEVRALSGSLDSIFRIRDCFSAEDGCSSRINVLTQPHYLLPLLLAWKPYGQSHLVTPPCEYSYSYRRPSSRRALIGRRITGENIIRRVQRHGI